MSEAKPGKVSVGLLSRAAMVLSTVTCSYLLGNVGVTPGVNASGIHLLDGDVNSSIALGVAKDATDISVDTAASGAIQVGKVTTYTDSNGVVHYNFYSGHDTQGEAIGLDINATGITNITNSSEISSVVDNVFSYGPSGQKSYPDVNNTHLFAKGISVQNAVDGKISNIGAISATATLNNDANNSEAYAVGIDVNESIAEGIVNTGTIIATATYEETGKKVGGHTGTQGVIEDSYGSETLDRKYAPGIYNIQEKEIRSESEAGKTQLEKDFKRVGPKIYNKDLADSNISYKIGAAGIHVNEGKTVTGGIEDHGYISSVLNDEGATLEGKADGHKNGITITPGGLATTSGAAPADGDEPDEADVNASKKAVADKEDELAQYDADLAAYNQALEDYQKAHPDAVKNLLRNNDANRTQDTSPQKAKYYNNGDFNADLNASAIEKWLAQQANVTRPTPPVNDVEKPAANVPSAPAPEIEATPVVDGSKTARIGDIINEAGATIKGAAGGHGVEIRATSGSNIASLLNDQKESLDANSTNNAYVTSGQASAYLGEGSKDRTISHNANGDVTNTLVGGLTNHGDIKGDGASSPILLNASSDVAVNDDDNNSDNIAISTVTDADGNVIPVKVNPSATVGVGHIVNAKDGKITGAAGANGIDLIASGDTKVSSNNDGNITGGSLSIKPSAVNAIGKVINKGEIAGGAGASGIGMDAHSEAKVVTGNGQLDGAKVNVAPVVTNRIDLLINTKDIKGGSGGNALKSEATTDAGVEAKDINNSTNVTINTKVSSTVGDLYNTGTMKQSLGVDGVHLTADGKSSLKADNIEGHSKITIESTATGGVRKKGNSNSTGNLVNGGDMSVSLSQNGMNLTAKGESSSDSVTGGGSKVNTKVSDSDIVVKSNVIAGVEGDLSNIATSIDENRTKTVSRGVVKASLSQDGAKLSAEGKTDLAMKNITNSSVTFEQNTTAGVGGDFTNGGTMSASLAKDAVELSSTATTLAHDKANSEINASVVTTRTTVKAGVGGNFVNGAYALETGEEKNATSLVDNETYTDADGNTHYVRTSVVAALVNEDNTSDVNSSGAHTNPLLKQSDMVYYHDREAALTEGVIKASLAHDGVKFTSDATNTVTPKLVTASTLEKNDTDGNGFAVQNNRSIVESYSLSDSRVMGNFENHGQITAGLAHRAVNSETTATGTLGDIGNSEIVSSSIAQKTVAKGGVVGDFINGAVSSKSGAGVAYTEQSGSSENSKEVPRIVYSRANNANSPKISSSLADDAINLSAKATNEIKVKSAKSVDAVTNALGTGSDSESYSESTMTARAHLTKSYITSTTEAIAGIGGSFINNGTVSVSLAKNGLNAESTGNANTIDGTGVTEFKGTDVIATMAATAGVRDNFVNDVVSLDSGDPTILYRDVYENGTAKHYLNGDDNETKRVKSNVIDSDAVVYSKDGRIDTDGYVYNKDIAAGEMKAALAKSPVKLDASTTTTIKPASIGTSEVNVVTLHTNYTDSEGHATAENNASQVDFNTTAKVVSNTTEYSTVRAGVGGKFTNKNKMSSALSADVVNVAGDATSNFGDSVTTVEGGIHTSATYVISGIGNGIGNSERGFLNAADVYDETLDTNASLIRVGSTNESGNPLLVDAKANDYLDDNATTPLKLQVGKTAAFWNKKLIVGDMKASLSKDLIKADAVATTNLKPTDVTAATGVLRDEDNSSITFDVVGSYVDGSAKAKISQLTSTTAGIKGDFVNQGKMSVSLSKQLVNTEATATTNLGDNGVTNVDGSELNATTIATGGIQGNFRNEVLSFDLDAGEAVLDTNAYDADPKVAFNKVDTVGQVVMSTSLSGENINLRSNAINTIDVASAGASDAVKYTGGDSWDLDQKKSDAISGKSKLTSSTYSIAGLSGDFYNSGVISASLSKELIDATASATNTLNAGMDKEYLGTDINLLSSSLGGIQGSFTNDVVSLANGKKQIVYKDVLDASGNPTYYVYQGKNTDNDSQTTQDNNISDAPIADDGSRVKSNVAESIVYDHDVAVGEITASLSKELVKLDAIATSTIAPAKLGLDYVNVVRPNGGVDKEFDLNDSIAVVSNLNAQTYATAGIGQRFTNKGKMSVSLSKDLLSVAGKATTDLGKTVTEIIGGNIDDHTVVIAGIGNDLNTTNKAGFINIANTYDKTKHVDTSKVNSGNSTQLIAQNNENDANVDENTTSLKLINSRDVAFWDKELVVGELSASLSKEVIKAEAVAAGTLTPAKIENATTDVNLTAKDALVKLDGYKVAGAAKADVNKTTKVFAGINGGFYNQGKITSSLSKDVLNVHGEATGILGDIGKTTIKGATVSQITLARGGLIGGGFRNEALSFDLDSGDVYTQADANGHQTPKARFAKVATIGMVEMSTASSGGDVLRLDAIATNTLDPLSIEASDAVMGNNGLESANSARANVSNKTYAYGGIEGDFYNNQKLEAKSAQKVINAAATSDNDLGTGSGTIKGSIVEASSLADARIFGNFINDVKLLDDGPIIDKTYKKTADGNDSNVVDTITYEQKIAKGEILSASSDDTLHMVATGNNNIKLDSVGNKEVTVANIDGNGEITGASSDYNVSSDISVSNKALAGITGKFINKGDIKGSAGKDVLNFQAIGTPSTIEIGKVGGGSVTAENTVISGINLDGASDVAFENRVTDFNTVLKTDENYDPTKKIVGTIEAGSGGTALNFAATGGAKNDVNVDTEVVTAGQSGIRDVATISNTNTNLSIINGKFINEGDIIGDSKYAINLAATNSAENDVHDGNVKDSGMLSSVVNTTVKSYINGDLINSGTIKTKTAGIATINIEANGGTSTAKGALADVNSTEYASAHGITISDTTSTTEAAINGMLNNSGTIEAAAGGKAIAVTATATADSSEFDLGDVSGENSGKVLKNRITATASLGSIYNIGEIKTANTTVIDVSSTASAKTAANGDEIKAKYEDTSAKAIASVGDIVNDAYTYQNKKKDVNKAFNGGVQLKPTEDVVAQNGGEYDFASYHEYSSTSEIPLFDGYNFSTGTKVAKTLEFNTTEELNALAYNDNNSTDNPVLSQKIGKITAGAGAAINIEATASDSEFATAKSSVGDILNRGVIDGGTGMGIHLKSAGDAATGATASATAGQIYNDVTDNTFESKKEGTLHSIIIGEIKGDAGAIKLEAGTEADRNVSITTVDQIVNNRVVLNKGDKVITMKKNGDDFENVKSTDDNYDIETLEKDTAFLGVIGSGKAKLAIDVGENAHVLNGIHNYGKISGNVHLGDAKLYLYGLVETNTSTLSDNIQMTQKELEGAADFDQAAGIVEASEGITKSYAGSEIIFEGAHLFNGSASGHQIPAIEADKIIIAKNAVVNIADDQEFDLSKTKDIYDRGLSSTFINKGILNVAAKKKVDIKGNYEQAGDGIFVSNMNGEKIVKDKVDHVYTDGYGQLNATGNADLTNGIKIQLDGTRSAEEWKAFVDSSTRIQDIVTAKTLSVGDANLTHDGEHTETALNVKVADNSSAFNFKVVEGSKGGGVDLLIIRQPVKSAREGGLTISTPHLAAQTSESISHIIDTRIDAEIGNYGTFSFIDTRVDERSGYSDSFRDDYELLDNKLKEKLSRRKKSDTDANLILAGPVGYWMKPFAGHSKQKDTGNVLGYNANTYGLIIGADREYSNWLVGFAASLAHSKAKGRGISNSTTTTLLEGTLYGSRVFDKGILNLQFGLGYLSNKRTRFATIEGKEVKADYDGYLIQAKAVYEKPVVLSDNALIYPYVSAELIHVKNDSYKETGPGTAVEKVSAVSNNSAILSVGIKGKYKLSKRSSLVGNVGVGYDFGSKRQKYRAQYIAAGIESEILSNKPGKFEYNIGIGYQTVTKKGTRIKFMLDHKGRRDYHDTMGSVKVHVPFN